MHVLYTVYDKEPRLSSKVLKFFMKASLVEVFLWAKFQVKIRNYKFAGDLGSCRKNSLKNQYLSPEAHAPNRDALFHCSLGPIERQWSRAKSDLSPEEVPS